MNIFELLNIPEACQVGYRMTKKQIIEKGNLGKRDRKFISDYLEKIVWTASFKSENTGIKSYISVTGIYDEIEVISLYFRKQGKEKDIAQIIQKSMPYHLLIVMIYENEVSFQLAEKQINQNDNEKRTIKEEYFCEWISFESSIFNAFIDSWEKSYTQNDNLRTLYKKMVNLVENLSIARVTGNFNTKGMEETKKDKQILQEIEDMENEIEKLRKELKKETRFSERLELNTRINEMKNKGLKLNGEIYSKEDL
jgi:hypothetical protein